MKTTLKALTAGLVLSLSSQAFSAENYQIDIKGMHAFIEFKIKHLGYSWLKGRFNDFDGQFVYDGDNIEKSSVNVTIKTASVDSNHGERDKHLRGDDFLNVEEHPTATFKSTKVVDKGEGKADIHGDLTLNGVTKKVVIDAEEIGAGEDPWGGFRRGFMGTTSIALKDYNIDFNLGPASEEVELILNIEGVRQ
ncbi:YceI family protein [Bermanella sp. R86510]|uniref:YceI family protein n=1 Tax=unclassified Bermanella TaxID=2627862 RepID=UPI0037CA5844